MSRYNKGYETKYKIINATKQLIYSKGFENTKIIDICKLANIRTGNFKYYFDSKASLSNEIFGDLLIKSYTFIDLKLDKGIKLNSIQKNIISSMIYYSVIFKDSKCINYYYVIIKNQSIFNYMSKNVRRILQRFVVDMGLNISNKELNFIASAESGMRREMFLEFIENQYDTTLFELISTIYILQNRMFKIEEEITLKYIEEAIDFIENHDFSHINLLI